MTSVAGVGLVKSLKERGAVAGDLECKWKGKDPVFGRRCNAGGRLLSYRGTFGERQDRARHKAVMVGSGKKRTGLVRCTRHKTNRCRAERIG
jgi:hypothetical protein